MKKILITGANGFVGQHLIEELKDNYAILGLAGSDKSIPKDSLNTKYVVADINSPSIKDLLEKYRPEMIVHLAAVTQSWFSNPEIAIKINLSGTVNLYEGVISVNSKKKYNPKILYISSAEVYGRTTNPKSISEDAPFFPCNHYAVSKLAADRLSYEYSQSHKLNIVIARPFTHTGPGQKEGFFVPDMVSQIVKLERDTNENTLFVGNLETIRDYLSVKDVVRAYRMLLETEIPPGEAINICSGKGILVKDLLDLILGMSKKAIKVEKDPKRMRPSDIPVSVGNNAKLKKIIDWQPKFSIEDTLLSTLDYWRNLDPIQ